MNDPLKGYQKRYLRGLAHQLKPVVIIGRNSLTDGTIKSISETLDVHELIKVRIAAAEDREMKKDLLRRIEDRCDCIVAGTTGHVAILYRPRDDPEKRRIILPERAEDES